MELFCAVIIVIIIIVALKQSNGIKSQIFKTIFDILANLKNSVLSQLLLTRDVRKVEIGINQPESPEYDTKLHMMVRFQSWSFGESCVPLYCLYSQE